MSGGERVRMAEEGGTHDFLARRRSEPDEVTEDRRAVEFPGIVRAHVRVARRVATKPSRAAKVRRVDAKAKRGVVKQRRGRVEVE